MPDRQPTPAALLDQIPDPGTVRHWLAESLRQAALLRILLRVAERKAKSKCSQGREAAHVE
ncbi:MAG TPA: hypothetical protein VK395_23625 [Gemmataceae bacterium]|nr:hypothetical protein [Gemmataceae bacterium]